MTIRSVRAIITTLAAIVATSFAVAAETRPQEDAAASARGSHGCRDMRLLSGLEPEVIDGKTIGLHAGSFADSSGCRVVSVPRMLRIDLEKVGLNGLDEGSPRPGDQYFIYMIGTADGEVGAIVSKQIAASTFNASRRYPIVRKLPWGFVYTRHGVPAMHLSGWPKPFTRYTDAASTPDWSVLQSGASAQWATVDTARFVPDNARMAYLLIEVRSTGGANPAGGYIRVVGTQGEGLMVGRVAHGSSNVMTLHQRVTSRGALFYRVDPGAVMNIYVLGYSNTEPS